MNKMEGLFCNPEGCDLYKRLKDDVERKKLLESKYAYKNVSSILDKDFCEKFPKETINRILELEIAYNICRNTEGLDVNVHNGCSKKDLGGPDFKIEDNKHNRNIFIECAYAHDPKKDNVDPECVIHKTETKSGIIPVKVGVDKIEISRISNTIESKAKKIKGYKEKGIIKDNDLVVLVIATSFPRSISEKVSWEFECVIGDKSICEDIDSVEFSENNDRKFKKNGKLISCKEESLNQFNVFIYADIFFSSKDENRNNQFYCYKAYIRTLPDDDSKEIIEKAFATNCIEFNRFLYRIDNHPRCTAEAIAEAYKKRKVLKK